MAVLTHPGISVDVDYYDSAEELRFSAYASRQAIASVVATGITVPVEEFLTYFLFHRKRKSTIGYQSYSQIEKQLGVAQGMLDTYVDYNNGTISVPATAEQLPIYIPENLGESIGLSVANRIHGLSQADWMRLSTIPGRDGNPSFD